MKAEKQVLGLEVLNVTEQATVDVPSINPVYFPIADIAGFRLVLVNWNIQLPLKSVRKPMNSTTIAIEQTSMNTQG